jgi:hypothetical protein
VSHHPSQLHPYQAFDFPLNPIINHLLADPVLMRWGSMKVVRKELQLPSSVITVTAVTGVRRLCYKE